MSYEKIVLALASQKKIAASNTHRSISITPLLRLLVKEEKFKIEIEDECLI